MRASVFIFLILLFTALSGCVSDEQIIIEELNELIRNQQIQLNELNRKVNGIMKN